MPSTDVVLLTLARALGDLSIGAALGFALALEPAPAVAAVVLGGLGLALGARVAHKKGRRARIAARLHRKGRIGNDDGNFRAETLPQRQRQSQTGECAPSDHDASL